MAILESIIALENSEGWKHYVNTVEAIIASHTPDITSIQNSDHEKQVATNVVFTSGLRRALSVIRHSKEKLKSLQRAE